jgi:hypothetical protein
MNSSVEKFKNGLLERDFFEEYHEKYGPQVNEETLSRVALDEPLFLGQMIDYGKLDNYTKALALSQLGVDADDQVYGTIYSKLNDPAPIVREGAYQGIVHYYIKEQEDNEPLEEKDRARKYSKLPMMLEDNLKNETSPAVQGQIREILEVMAFYS